MRPCTKCGITKPLSEYYKAANYADGHMRICKECSRKAMKAIEKSDSRQKTYQKYRQSEKGKKARCESQKRYEKRHPDKIKAHKRARYAREKGILEAKPCEVCGCLKVEGHHEDYEKPLDVVWLCHKHHIEKHSQTKGD